MGCACTKSPPEEEDESSRRRKTVAPEPDPRQRTANDPARTHDARSSVDKNPIFTGVDEHQVAFGDTKDAPGRQRTTTTAAAASSSLSPRREHQSPRTCSSNVATDPEADARESASPNPLERAPPEATDDDPDVHVPGADIFMPHESKEGTTTAIAAESVTAAAGAPASVEGSALDYCSAAGSPVGRGFGRGGAGGATSSYDASPTEGFAGASHTLLEDAMFIHEADYQPVFTGSRGHMIALTGGGTGDYHSSSGSLPSKSGLSGSQRGGGGVGAGGGSVPQTRLITSPISDGISRRDSSAAAQTRPATPSSGLGSVPFLVSATSESTLRSGRDRKAGLEGQSFASADRSSDRGGFAVGAAAAHSTTVLLSPSDSHTQLNAAGGSMLFGFVLPPPAAVQDAAAAPPPTLTPSEVTPEAGGTLGTGPPVPPNMDPLAESALDHARPDAPVPDHTTSAAPEAAAAALWFPEMPRNESNVSISLSIRGLNSPSLGAATTPGSTLPGALMFPVSLAPPPSRPLDVSPPYNVPSSAIVPRHATHSAVELESVVTDHHHSKQPNATPAAPSSAPQAISPANTAGGGATSSGSRRQVTWSPMPPAAFVPSNLPSMLAHHQLPPAMPFHQYIAAFPLTASAAAAAAPFHQHQPFDVESQQAAGYILTPSAAGKGASAAISGDSSPRRTPTALLPGAHFAGSFISGGTVSEPTPTPQTGQPGGAPLPLVLPGGLQAAQSVDSFSMSPKLVPMHAPGTGFGSGASLNAQRSGSHDYSATAALPTALPIGGLPMTIAETRFPPVHPSATSGAATATGGAGAPGVSVSGASMLAWSTSHHAIVDLTANSSSPLGQVARGGHHAHRRSSDGVTAATDAIPGSPASMGGHGGAASFRLPAFDAPLAHLTFEEPGAAPMVAPATTTTTASPSSHANYNNGKHPLFESAGYDQSEMALLLQDISTVQFADAIRAVEAAWMHLVGGDDLAADTIPRREGLLLELVEQVALSEALQIASIIHPLKCDDPVGAPRQRSRRPSSVGDNGGTAACHSRHQHQHTFFPSASRVSRGSASLGASSPLDCDDPFPNSFEADEGDDYSSVAGAAGTQSPVDASSSPHPPRPRSALDAPHRATDPFTTCALATLNIAHTAIKVLADVVRWSMERPLRYGEIGAPGSCPVAAALSSLQVPGQGSPAAGFGSGTHGAASGASSRLDSMAMPSSSVFHSDRSPPLGGEERSSPRAPPGGGLQSTAPPPPSLAPPLADAPLASLLNDGSPIVNPAAATSRTAPSDPHHSAPQNGGGAPNGASMLAAPLSIVASGAGMGSISFYFTADTSMSSDAASVHGGGGAGQQRPGSAGGVVAPHALGGRASPRDQQSTGGFSLSAAQKRLIAAHRLAELSATFEHACHFAETLSEAWSRLNGIIVQRAHVDPSWEAALYAEANYEHDVANASHSLFERSLAAVPTHTGAVEPPSSPHAPSLRGGGGQRGTMTATFADDEEEVTGAANVDDERPAAARTPETDGGATAPSGGDAGGVNGSMSAAGHPRWGVLMLPHALERIKRVTIRCLQIGAHSGAARKRRQATLEAQSELLLRQLDTADATGWLLPRLIDRGRAEASSMARTVPRHLHDNSGVTESSMRLYHYFGAMPSRYHAIVNTIRRWLLLRRTSDDDFWKTVAEAADTHHPAKEDHGGGVLGAGGSSNPNSLNGRSGGDNPSAQTPVASATSPTRSQAAATAASVSTIVRLLGFEEGELFARAFSAAFAYAMQDCLRDVSGDAATALRVSDHATNWRWIRLWRSIFDAALPLEGPRSTSTSDGGGAAGVRRSTLLARPLTNTLVTARAPAHASAPKPGREATLVCGDVEEAAQLPRFNTPDVLRQTNTKFFELVERLAVHFGGYVIQLGHRNPRATTLHNISDLGGTTSWLPASGYHAATGGGVISPRGMVGREPVGAVALHETLSTSSPMKLSTTQRHAFADEVTLVAAAAPVTAMENPSSSSGTEEHQRAYPLGGLSEALTPKLLLTASVSDAATTTSGHSKTAPGAPPGLPLLWSFKLAFSTPVQAASFALSLHLGLNSTEFRGFCDGSNLSTTGVAAGSSRGTTPTGPAGGNATTTTSAGGGSHLFRTASPPAHLHLGGHGPASAWNHGRSPRAKIGLVSCVVVSDIPDERSFDVGVNLGPAGKWTAEATYCPANDTWFYSGEAAVLAERLCALSHGGQSLTPVSTAGAINQLLHCADRRYSFTEFNRHGSGVAGSMTRRNSAASIDLATGSLRRPPRPTLVPHACPDCGDKAPTLAGVLNADVVAESVVVPGLRRRVEVYGIAAKCLGQRSFNPISTHNTGGGPHDMIASAAAAAALLDPSGGMGTTYSPSPRSVTMLRPPATGRSGAGDDGSSSQRGGSNTSDDGNATHRPGGAEGVGQTAPRRGSIRSTGGTVLDLGDIDLMSCTSKVTIPVAATGQLML